MFYLSRPLHSCQELRREREKKRGDEERETRLRMEKEEEKEQLDQSDSAGGRHLEVQSRETKTLAERREIITTDSLVQCLIQGSFGSCDGGPTNRPTAARDRDEKDR